VPRHPIVLVSDDASIGTCGDGATWTKLAPSALPSQATDRALNAVTCSGNNGVSNEYWAVGASGLVIRSTDGGHSFTHVPITGIASAATATLQGVDFDSLDTGFVVGSYSPTPGTFHGVAYRVTNATNPLTRVWTDLSPSPAVAALLDVSVSSSTAYAVGGDLVNGVPAIVAWRPSLTLFEPQAGALALAGGKALRSVAMFPASTGFEIFVGGDDGFLLWSPQGSTWSVGDIETGHNVTGLSFLSSSSGFAVAIGDASDAVVMRYGP
jgi:hypothetical protein